VPADAGVSLDARVVAIYGSRCLIEFANGQAGEAVRRGAGRDAAVGDRVRLRPGSMPVLIDAVQERTSLLYRSDDRRSKVLAANVDQLALVFAPQPRFSVHFLWRAMIAASAAGIDALVVLNKVDLDCAQADPALAQLVALGARCLRIGARNDPVEAARALRREFEGRATLLVGQSGMGKSTIVNLMVGAQARTQALSPRTQSGRHTTSASRWHRLGSGDAALVDTPGFQEFGLTHLSRARIAHLMPDLERHSQGCRFGDCLHLQEPDCAVRAALLAGLIEAERYAFYEQVCSGCPA